MNNLLINNNFIRNGQVFMNKTQINLDKLNIERTSDSRKKVIWDRSDLFNKNIPYNGIKTGTCMDVSTVDIPDRYGLTEPIKKP